MCDSEDMRALFAGAKFIKATEEAPVFSSFDPLPFFRREIVLSEQVRHAELLVQAPGFGKFYLNGREITEDLFISATSDYDKILWYNAYDVTHLLQEGENVIGAIAGNGFLNESFETAWDFDTVPWRDAPKLLLCLRVNGRVVAVSDEQFKVSTAHSYITFSHIRSGEYVDMRKYDTTWREVGFDDSTWQQALTCELPEGARLLPVPCEAVREFERFAPTRIFTAEDGATVVDFGETISGYAEVTLSEPAGTEIVFYYAEEVDGAGNLKHNEMDDHHFYRGNPFQINRMIASGKTDTFKPLFSYHGFRYIRITGLTKPLAPTQITAIFTHQNIARRADFNSGNAVLNYIYRAGIRSSYSNMFWTMTDCPTREKLGWTNDAAASMAQLLMNFDILPMLEKWFEDMKASMFADGSLHGTIPAPDWPWGHICGPVCDQLFFEMPYRVYLHEGKPDMLLEGIPYFKRYVAFLENALANGTKFELDDWLSNARHAVPGEMIWKIYLLKDLQITAFALGLAGEDKTLYEEKAAALIATLAEEYLDESGNCKVEQQAAIAMLLMMGVGDKQTLSAQLIARVQADGYQFRLGMVGMQFVYDALTEVGRSDLAYRLITETEPGYRTWCERGETTLWEKWNGEDDGSHNHHMLSGVIAWFYTSLLGIAPDVEAPAFEKITLRPSFVRELGEVSGYLGTVRGRIEAAWCFAGDTVTYTVTVPAGVTAYYNGQKLQTGKNIFQTKFK
ncbi:MAG: family 78 glycoside hydrolase catalytic domain [Clostridia bacterium]|nr:family 78 glycoside hydrolase catalytic domain [Clostridia bacterium]